jgi:hypothetical protein
MNEQIKIFQKDKSQKQLTFIVRQILLTVSNFCNYKIEQ